MSLSFLLPAFMGGRAGAFALSLNGETISVSGGGPSQYAGVRINTDGTVDKVTGSLPDYTQIDGSTDWIIPNNAVSKRTWHVKCSVSVGNGPDTGDTINVWHELSTNREWAFEQVDVGTNSGTWLIELSYDGGTTTHESGSYVVDVERI